MSSYDIVTPIAGAQPIADTSATQLHPLGLIVQASDNASTAYGCGEFIYLKGLASTVVGSFVTTPTTTQLRFWQLMPLALLRFPCLLILLAITVGIRLVVKL